jgi:hypothetical protein
MVDLRLDSLEKEEKNLKISKKFFDKFKLNSQKTISWHHYSKLLPMQLLEKILFNF